MLPLRAQFDARASNAWVNVMMVYADSFALLALVREVSLPVPANNLWVSLACKANAVDSQWHAMEKETGQEPRQPALRTKRRRWRCSVRTLAARPRNQGRRDNDNETRDGVTTTAQQPHRHETTCDGMTTKLRSKISCGGWAKLSDSHLPCLSIRCSVVRTFSNKTALFDGACMGLRGFRLGEWPSTSDLVSVHFSVSDSGASLTQVRG